MVLFFIVLMLVIESLNVVGNHISKSALDAMKSTIDDANKDKEFYLKKMQDYNKIGNVMSERMNALGEAQRNERELSKAEKKEMIKKISEARKKAAEEHSKKSRAELTTKKNERKKSETKSVSKSELDKTIRTVEAQQQTLRNKRQMSSTAFRNVDQRSNQLHNIISGVLKTTGDARGLASRGGS